jgi:hypothetical protein
MKTPFSLMGYKLVIQLSNPDHNVNGYISKEINGTHYAEIMDSDGNSRYACGTYFQLIEWMAKMICEMCINQEYNERERSGASFSTTIL